MGFPNLVAIAFASRLMRSLLLGTLVFVTKMVSVYLRQHFVNKADCGIYYFVLAALCARCQIVKYGPSVSPKHPTNYGQAGTPNRFHHFAIYPRST